MLRRGWILDKLDGTFEDVEIGRDEFVGLFCAEGVEDSLGLFSEVGVIRLQDLSDDLDELC